MAKPQEDTVERTPRRAHRLGPQRNPEIDKAVLEATRDLLSERGYSDTSIDAIATRAGVGRPTIYRRWPTKAHVVHDAVYPSIEPALPPGTSAAERIEVLVAGAYTLFGTPAARAAVPGLMSDTRADPELRERLVAEQLDPIREVLGHILTEGIADGSLRDTVDVDTIVDVLAGAAIFAMSVRDAEDGPALAAHVTDVLLHGVLTHR